MKTGCVKYDETQHVIEISRPQILISITSFLITIFLMLIIIIVIPQPSSNKDAISSLKYGILLLLPFLLFLVYKLITYMTNRYQVKRVDNQIIFSDENGIKSINIESIVNIVIDEYVGRQKEIPIIWDLFPKYKKVILIGNSNNLEIDIGFLLSSMEMKFLVKSLEDMRKQNLTIAST